MSKPERWRSEGHRRLAELSQSGAEIARAIGMSRGAVSAWKSGAKSPNESARAALEGAFKIPARSWSDRAAEPPVRKPARKRRKGRMSPAVSPDLSPAPSPRRGAVDEPVDAVDPEPDPEPDRFPEFDAAARASIGHLDNLLARVRRTIRTGDLRPGDLAKLAAEERRLTMDREKLLMSNYESARLEILEDVFVREAPAWAQLMSLLQEVAAIVAPYPEAAERMRELVIAYEERDQRAREGSGE